MSAQLEDVPGKRLGNETSTYVAKSQQIRPLRDHIIVEPIDWAPSQILKIVYHGKPLRGVVRAVGPGCHPLKYNGPKGRRNKSWYSAIYQPTDVKVGDIVELGGLELRGYLFHTFLWGSKEHILCREADVAMVIENGS